MSEKYKKRAFTIVELIITVVILVVVFFVASNVANKTVKSSKKSVNNENNYLICYKDKKEDAHGGAYREDIGGCDFSVNSDIINKEFITIKLIGGGGGGSSFKMGGTGEERTVYYPSLLLPFAYSGEKACNSPACADCDETGACTKCVKGYVMSGSACRVNFYYRAVLGKGGEPNENGGQTTLMVMDKSDNSILKVLETAAGGATSINRFNENVSLEVEGQSLGLVEDVNETDSEHGSGLGGSKENSGNPGEVEIKW